MCIRTKPSLVVPQRILLAMPLALVPTLGLQVPLAKMRWAAERSIGCFNMISPAIGSL
jgi:hypothetical protein